MGQTALEEQSDIQAFAAPYSQLRSATDVKRDSGSRDYHYLSGAMEPISNTDTSATLDEPISHRVEKLVMRRRNLETIALPLGQKPTEQLLDEIKAVVSRIEDEIVHLNCRLPLRSVEIAVNKLTVPSELCVYGTPVSVKVDRTNGFRKLTILPRTELDKQYRPDDADELEAWVRSGSGQ